MKVGMIMSRRGLLSGAAVLALGLGVAACSDTQIQQFETDWNAAVSAIQEGVAKVAQYIPTVESIAQTAASLFGPAYSTVVTIGSAALNSVIAALEAAVGSLTPSSGGTASLTRLRKLSATAAPIPIGSTPQGVAVAGWR